MWALGVLAGKSGGGASRGSVVKYALLGAAGGAGMATVIGLSYPDRVSNLPVDWPLFGAMIGGGFRLVKRSRG